MKTVFAVPSLSYSLLTLNHTLLILYISNAAPTECIVNTKLSAANRASGVLRKSFLKCDRRNLPTVGKWHQFVGDAGTKIPNSCVPTQRCGSHAPGWMQGEHPKKEDGVVDRKVCFHWSNNCCRWSVMIKVRNCGGHYVYKLEKPPTCYLRYCGDKGHSKRTTFWFCLLGFFFSNIFKITLPHELKGLI